MIDIKYIFVILAILIVAMYGNTQETRNISTTEKYMGYETESFQEPYTQKYWVDKNNREFKCYANFCGQLNAIRIVSRVEYRTSMRRVEIEKTRIINILVSKTRFEWLFGLN